jgi:hypothetical protein
MKKTIIQCFLLLIAATSVLAADECPTYTTLTRSLNVDTEIPVILRTTSGIAQTATALNNTLAALNADKYANGTGNTFTLATEVPTDGRQYLEVYFDDASECGASQVNCHGAVMRSMQKDGGPAGVQYVSGIIHIGVSKILCAGQTKACYDSEKANFEESLEMSIYHEISHAQGQGDTGFGATPDLDSIMSPLRGINNANNSRNRTRCDLQKLKAIADRKRPVPAPAYTYTCVV